MLYSALFSAAEGLFQENPSMAQTLYDKRDAHLVEQRDDGTAPIYIDRHLLHEVTSAA